MKIRISIASEVKYRKILRSIICDINFRSNTMQEWSVYERDRF